MPKPMVLVHSKYFSCFEAFQAYDTDFSFVTTCLREKSTKSGVNLSKHSAGTNRSEAGHVFYDKPEA